ncbi:MAG: TetR/AcrR family transcriptional regulator [Acutalibacteraceae bacterium]|nr:TetR/AcrR family transcriptional regulator [Acutalibacteraceae bacterium]
MDIEEKKPDGRRVRMTKLLLKESLIELMKKKSIHVISIKEICEGADVNRSTFYRHYDTQYDLYDDIINDISDDILVIYRNCAEEGMNVSRLLTKIFTYIEDQREKFLVLLSDNGNISLGETYNRITERFISRENTGELGAYVAQFIAAGMTSILWSWLNAEERKPPEQIAGLINYLIKHGFKTAVDFVLGTK